MANTTPAQAIVNVREDRLHSTLKGYPDSVAIKHYNRIYKHIIAKMRLLDEEYFYESGKANTNPLSSEYTINTIMGGGIEYDITRIKGVYIKYSPTNTYYTKVRDISPNTLEHGKDYYETEQSKNDPFYFIQDGSIWVYPKTTEVVTDGLMIETVIQPPALITTSTADSVEVPERINELIEDGMVSFGLEYLGKPLNEAIAQENLYKERLKEAMRDLSTRGDQIVQQSNCIQYNLR